MRGTVKWKPQQHSSLLLQEASSSNTWTLLHNCTLRSPEAEVIEAITPSAEWLHAPAQAAAA